MIFKFWRVATFLLAFSIIWLVGVLCVHAQMEVGDTTTYVPSAATTNVNTSTTSTSGSTLPGFDATDIANALNGATTQIQNLFKSVIAGGVSMADATSSDTDVIAGGLAMIVITFAGLNFAGNHHPHSAWADLLQEILTLGFFAFLYTSYDSVVQTFCNQFSLTSNLISQNVPAWTKFSSLVGTIFQTITDFTGNIGLLSITAAQIIEALILVIVGLITVFTYCVTLFFTQLGYLLLAVGVVVGKYAVAFGILSLTRSYFKSWLNYMIGSGMYIVVGSAVTNLAVASTVAQIGQVSTKGVHNMFAVIYGLVLAIFLLFLSFEIPRIAGSILGGTASADGSAVSSSIKFGMKQLTNKKK